MESIEFMGLVTSRDGSLVMKKRPSRDKIFIINLHNKWRCIGFTVENPEKVITIFESKELLKGS